MRPNLPKIFFPMIIKYLSTVLALLILLPGPVLGQDDSNTHHGISEPRTMRVLEPMTATNSRNFHVNPLKLGLRQAVGLALQNNLGLQLREDEKIMAQGAALGEQGIFDPLLEAGANHRDSKLTPTFPPEWGGVSEDKEANWQTALKKRLESGTEIDLTWLNSRQENDLRFNTLQPVYNSTLQLSLSQPLLRGLGQEAQTANRQAANKEAEAATYRVDSQSADLAQEVKSAYWQLVFARQDIEVKKLSLRLARQLRDEIAEKIKVGSLAQVEIYQPQSEVARREQQLIGAQRAIGLAEDALKLILNCQDWQQDILPVDLPPSRIPTPKLAEVLQQALAQRPDLRAAHSQLAAARLREVAARDQLNSRLNLTGTIGLTGVDDGYGQALNNLATSSDTSWQVGVIYAKSLGNHQAQGRHQQAKANLNHSRTQLALIKQQIKRQARQSVRDVELADKAVEASVKTALATQKRLEAQQAKFEAGLATTYDVLAAQEAYAQSLSGENLSKVQLAAAAAELDRIQGKISLPKP